MQNQSAYPEGPMERNQSKKSRKMPSIEEQTFPNKGASRVGKTLDENSLQGTSLYWVF